MPRLIINADDFGAGRETDRGIIESFAAGGISSASLLANGSSCVSAAAAALELNLPLGVHLNLADGYPLSGPIAGLTLADGRLPGKHRLRLALQEQQVAQEDLRRELQAQIERVLALGVRPDHLDTHQHFFLFPEVRALVLELAQHYKINALRLPCPVEPAAADPEGELGAELKLYRRLSGATRAAVQRSGLRSPLGLFGMPELNRLDALELERCLAQIPAGDWELMVHPGYLDSSNPFSGQERCIERTVLSAPHIRQLFEKYRIHLMTFGELQ